MAYKKVWKNGSLDVGAALSNSAKRSAVARRKRERERERDRKKAQRDAERARKEREKEAVRREKAGLRAAKAREKEAASRAAALEKARKADEKKRQKLIAQEKKEEEKLQKKLTRLKGLFLEHDIPLNLFDVDLRVMAYNFEEENGITSVSGFKKVTIPHLQKNLFKLAIKLHVNNTFDSLYESELNEMLQLPKVIAHPEIIKFESICKKSLVKALPDNLDFEEFASYKNPINSKAISEYIEANILPLVPAIEKKIAAIEKKEKEAKQRAKEQKELDAACEKAMLHFEKNISKSVQLGKSMKSQISKMKSDLAALDESYNSKWFGKKKIAKEVQDLAKVIWKRTPQLIELIILIEADIRILKNRAENPSSVEPNPKVFQVLESNGYYEKTLERFKKLYAALFDNLEMRLANQAKALSYYEDDRQAKAIEKVKNAGLELSKDSKNISKLFIKFGG